MQHRTRKVVQAFLETPSSGTIELVRDWRARDKPDLRLEDGPPFASLEPVADTVFARSCGHFIGPRGLLYFVLFLDDHPEFDPSVERLFVAGDFNGWQACVGNVAWELQPACLGSHSVMVWSGPADALLNPSGQRFKFVTQEHRWLPVSPAAANGERDAQGNVNHRLDAERTGHHLFHFRLHAPLDLSRSWKVVWDREGEGAHLRPDGTFFQLHSDLSLGALVRHDETIFRLFAPRAAKVELFICSSLDKGVEPVHYPLTRRSEPVENLRERLLSVVVPAQRARHGGPAPANWQGVWEVTLDQNLHGWFYWYQIDGAPGPFNLFDKHHRILDPYAFAAVGPRGPGIVVDPSRIQRSRRTEFKTPGWQDLVIAEAHVRDLVAHAPVQLTPDERLGFNGLRKYVESPDFHLHKLGVNCVELQPIHEYDTVARAEYAWGYMPVSWFAPASQYSSSPSTASGITEFQELVAAFHRRGMAVVLDVVFNHQGDPAGLMFIDRHYYFEADNQGNLSNWSGCGNDLRASSAMACRLIIDSCIHMIDTYGVDGFRFDLAELLGVDVLIRIERALKAHKRDVILIAEPWSFRGHVAGQLADTGWSSWNDGYRNFARDYVRGGGSAAQAEYFLKGSPWYFARWPAQTVNYTESHDDRTWIDMITEHGHGSGFHPTATDRTRSHLMTAMLFASLGIPMLSAGQDFLRSKHGVNNTYLRGDLNALDYTRIHRYPGTHAYFAEWIAFRLSPRGQLLRQWSMPSEGFFRAFTSPDSPSLVLLYNADGSQGPTRLLFAVNATGTDALVDLDEATAALPWFQVADQERFYAENFRGLSRQVERQLLLPAMSCALWQC